MPNRISYLFILSLTVLLFIPMIGHGFIHDDFLHLYSVANDPLWRGLTKASGGSFYAPVTWLSFKLDWTLWGFKPPAFAAVNLAIHLTNILLLQRLALALYQSAVAARWAALGFALLYPANSWAMMWISTRAHLLVTLFFLAALLSTVWYTETRRRLAFAAILLFAALSLFSKESGVTIPVSIALVLYNQRITKKDISISRREIVLLFSLLAIILLLYLAIRGQSGAVSINFSQNQWYSYRLDPKVLLENLLRYGWRTYGLLGILAGAIALSCILGGNDTNRLSISKFPIIFSLTLFITTIAPFILLPGRSGIYTYLPGAAAALLLSAVVRNWYQPFSGPMPRPDLITTSPIIILIVIYCGLTVGQNLKWMKMAEINTRILRQIAAQYARPEPNSLFILSYSEIDQENRFPESMAWGFSSALRLMYSDPTLSGEIIQNGELEAPNSAAIHLVYQRNRCGEPEVISLSAIENLSGHGVSSGLWLTKHPAVLSTTSQLGPRRTANGRRSVATVIPSATGNWWSRAHAAAAY